MKVAGILILEELEHALSRGATIYAEIVGYGMTCDAYHMTAPVPGGIGAARCMQMAAQRCDVRPGTDQLYQRPWHQHRGQRPNRNPAV